MKCIICGKEKSLQVYTLPHGEVHLCYESKCQKTFTVLLNDKAVPIVWISLQDLYDENFTNRLTKEEHDNLSTKDLMDIAEEIQQILCDDNFFESFHVSADSGVELWKREKERELVRDSPKEELPLLIGNLKYKRSITLLEDRLRKGKGK